MSFFSAIAGPVLGIANGLIQGKQAAKAAKDSRNSLLSGINNAQSNYGRAVGLTPTAKEAQYTANLEKLNKNLTAAQKQSTLAVTKYQKQLQSLNVNSPEVKAKLKKDPNYLQNETARLNNLIAQEQAKPTAIQNQITQTQQDIDAEKQNRDALALKPLQEAQQQQQEALQRGYNLFQQANTQGRSDVANAQNAANQALQQGYDRFQQANTEGRTDVINAQNAANQALQQGYDRFQQANTQGRSDIQSGLTAGNEALLQGYNKVIEALSPYTQQGNAAIGQMGALAGANGYDQQQQAVNNISQSPLFQALQNQAQEALLQKASATGGLRGGNTQAALATLAPAMLNQQINEQYNRLNPLANYGYGASSTLAQAGQNYGTNLSQNNMSAANQFANLQTLLGNAGLSTGQQTSANNINSGSQLANLQTLLGNAGLSTGQQTSANNMNAGSLFANLQSQLGQAGQQYGTNLANYAGSYGVNASKLFSDYINNLTDLNLQAGGVGSKYINQRAYDRNQITGNLFGQFKSMVNPLNSIGSLKMFGGQGWAPGAA